MSRQGNPFVWLRPRDANRRLERNPGFPAAGPCSNPCAVITACGRPAAPDLVRRLAASRKYRWRSTMPERSPIRAGLRQEIPRRVHRNGGDDDHKAITPFVTNAHQKVIKRTPGDVISVSVTGRPRARPEPAEAPRPEPAEAPGPELGTRHRPFGGNDLFVETHKATGFRLSEHVRGCPLKSKDAPVRRGTLMERSKDPIARTGLSAALARRALHGACAVLPAAPLACVSVVWG